MSGPIKPVNIEIDPEVVNVLLKEKITEAIGASIVDKEEVLDGIIHTVLTMKVDSDGKPSTYRGATPYIEYAARRTIRAAVETALKEVMEKKQEEITKKVVTQINRSQTKLAKSLVDGLAESLKARWSSTVRIELDGKER